MGLTNPGWVLIRLLLQSTSPMLLTLSDISLCFINLFRLASLLAVLVEFILIFLTSAPAWFFKITKVTPFVSQVILQRSIAGPVFFLFSSIIFLHLHFLPSAAVFMLMTWPFGHPPLWFLLLRRLTRSSNSTIALV